MAGPWRQGRSPPAAPRQSRQWWQYGGWRRPGGRSSQRREDVAIQPRDRSRWPRQSPQPASAACRRCRSPSQAIRRSADRHRTARQDAPRGAACQDARTAGASATPRPGSCGSPNGGTDGGAGSARCTIRRYFPDRDEWRQSRQSRPRPRGRTPPASLSPSRTPPHRSATGAPSCGGCGTGSASRNVTTSPRSRAVPVTACTLPRASSPPRIGGARARARARARGRCRRQAQHPLDAPGCRRSDRGWHGN